MQLCSLVTLAMFYFFQATVHGYPSDQNCPASEYSRLDFDYSDEDYSEFFNKVSLQLLPSMMFSNRVRLIMIFLFAYLFIKQCVKPCVCFGV